MESDERGEADVDDREEPLDDEFNLEGEFHEDDLETSGALVCSTPAPAVEIPTIVVDEAQVVVIYSLRLIFHQLNFATCIWSSLAQLEM